MNKEEREVALKEMQKTSDDFYHRAVSINNHPFIEFAGLMNEYIKMCEIAHEKGIDFSDCNTHSGQDLPMEPYHRNYINEKLECIFTGRSFIDKSKKAGGEMSDAPRDGSKVILEWEDGEVEVCFFSKSRGAWVTSGSHMLARLAPKKWKPLPNAHGLNEIKAKSDLFDWLSTRIKYAEISLSFGGRYKAYVECNPRTLEKEIEEAKGFEREAADIRAEEERERRG
jgi:hypothetical protein